MDNIPKEFTTPLDYPAIYNEFRKYHSKITNIVLHLITTQGGIWFFINIVASLIGENAAQTAMIAYAAYLFAKLPVHVAATSALFFSSIKIMTATTALGWVANIIGVAACYTFQDVAHYICGEPTFESVYMGIDKKDPRFIRALFEHNIFLLPLVQNCMWDRILFFVYPYNRAIHGKIEADATKVHIETLKELLAIDKVRNDKTTVHFWIPKLEPRHQEAFNALRDCDEIRNGFDRVFNLKGDDYVLENVAGMNEVYVSADDYSQTNSDQVFYMNHVDGPYGWLPSAFSVYRVILAITENERVQTELTQMVELDSPNASEFKPRQTLTEGDFYGFDFNRELHLIRNKPNANNPRVRRVVLKLHYATFPRGMEIVGRFVAMLVTRYNIWARNLFLYTLNPKTLSEHVYARYVLSMTFMAALAEKHIGATNFLYLVTLAFVQGVIGIPQNLWVAATSFVHYAIYISVYYKRGWMLNYGNFIRDVVLFKCLAWINLMVIGFGNFMADDGSSFLRDTVFGLIICTGALISMGATYRLGKTGTYFGAELGIIKNPTRIDKFPYGTIPHPMILGQIVLLLALLVHPVWFSGYRWVVAMHIALYSTHALQEEFEVWEGSDRVRAHEE